MLTNVVPTNVLGGVAWAGVLTNLLGGVTWAGVLTNVLGGITWAGVLTNVLVGCLPTCWAGSLGQCLPMCWVGSLGQGCFLQSAENVGVALLVSDFAAQTSKTIAHTPTHTHTHAHEVRLPRKEANPCRFNALSVKNVNATASFMKSSWLPSTCLKRQTEKQKRFREGTIRTCQKKHSRSIQRLG